MAGEEQQETGREGVRFAREWLESTTRVQVPWTVYEMPQLTTLTLLDGSRESWDLSGFFTDGIRRQFYAEVKNYNDDSQGGMYREYLTDCYSATAKMIAEENDQKHEFMWITWHPFLTGSWTKLCDESTISDAVAKFPDKLGGHRYNREVGSLVANRLWLIVLSRRQPELMMSREYLGHIRSYVTKGA